MSEPRVSIGMPVYNGEDLLPQTLDSIVSQTFEDFEVVISDNASTDSTPEICRAYVQRDKRIRYERTDTNIGVLANFNRVFRLSHGRYFKWHAHDDLVGSLFLERCTDILERDPTTVLVGTRVGLIEPEGSPVSYDANTGMFVTSYGERIPPPASTDSLASPHRLKRFRGVLFDIGGAVHSEFVFGLFRSDALAATSLIGGYIGAEKVLLARLSLVGRFREVPEELFFRRYRQGREGVSGRGTWLGRIRLAKALAPDRRVILFPFARQVSGYFDAIRNADISAPEKVRCGAMVVEKVANVGVERVKRMPAKIRKAITRP